MARYFIPNSDGLFWSGNLTVSDALNLMCHPSIFWNNIVKAWCIYNFSKPTCIEDILNQQIWYNSNILIRKTPIYCGPLHSKGILYLKDLVKQDGQLMTVYEILNQYSVNRKYMMKLNSILGAVPQQWKVLIKNSYLDFDISAISLPNFQKCMSSTNMSKLVYKYTVSRKCKFFPDRIIDKWTTDLGQGLHVDREFISSAFGLIVKATISPKHRVFQFKLIHRSLVTNKSLYEWKLKDTNLCSFCENQEETIYHLLWGCTMVQTLWKAVFDWLADKTSSNINFTSKEILLGIDESNLVFYNAVFILVKQYIYSSRCKNTPLNFYMLLNNIKFYIQTEKYIAVKNNKLNYHNKKWAMLQAYL